MYSPLERYQFTLYCHMPNVLGIQAPAVNVPQ